MKKNYVLDTNVFITDPECIFKFEDNDLYLSPVTLQEINKLKTADGETGYMARRAKQTLDTLRNCKGNIKNGLLLGEGKGKLHIITDESFENFLPAMSKTNNDDHILAAACYLKHSKNTTNEPVVLVTNDIDLAFLCDLVELETQKYKNTYIEKNYYGRIELDVEPEDIDNFYLHGEYIPKEELMFNQYVLLKDWNGRSAIGKFNGAAVIKLPYFNEDERPFDVIARNNGQRFSIDALMSPVEETPLAIIKGPAGTAKTFLSLACGLEQTLNQGKYDKILITRANVGMDATFGFLPGSELDKLTPQLRPFKDNIEALFAKQECKNKDGMRLPSLLDELIASGVITAESMEYMRGRSLRNTYLIVDEAQNCTQNQILSIVSRIGEGSKVVLLGDPDQIDSKFLSKKNNGLVFAASKFTGNKLCSQVTFYNNECVRSPLAKEASRILK